MSSSSEMRSTDSSRTSRSGSTEMRSTGRSKRSRSLASERILESIESTARELSVLFNEGKITLRQATCTVKKFQDFHGLRILWSRMSLENKIKYVKDLAILVVSLSKAPTGYSLYE